MEILHKNCINILGHMNNMNIKKPSHIHNNVLQASLLLKYAKTIQNNFSSSFPSISHTEEQVG